MVFVELDCTKMNFVVAVTMATTLLVPVGCYVHRLNVVGRVEYPVAYSSPFLKWLLLSWFLHKWQREFSDANFEIGKPC